ncbi:MAG: NAD-dependent epimerase/dehydratase family protein [Chitinophagaceae bacterium]|nr:NAD-dependent epimerase/dehydratase family protein [Chitinophagaceae bacterium]
MVIGNGLLGSKFYTNYYNNPDILIFASGVSNSKSTNQSGYSREFELVKVSIDENPAKHFVYFSTCSINDPDEQGSLYTTHKKNIEAYIMQTCANWNIFRVSNVVGKTNNPNTVLNYFYNCITTNIPFALWRNAYRNLIDIDDLFKIVCFVLEDGKIKNQVVNIANSKNYSVVEIVQEIETYCNKNGNYTLLNKGSNYKIDVTDLHTVLYKLQINFPSNYLSLLLKKYYQKA